MEYSTKRNKLILPEYGRNIQKLVEYILTIEDREKRNIAANEIINIMGSMNPHLRDINDFKHKLWDQLALMASFKLDIDSPYPIPTKETFEKPPKQIPYIKGNIKYRFMGRTMEKLINTSINVENIEEQNELVKIIANHMKKLYIMWNKESVEDKVIFDKLDELSKGRLKVSEDFILNDAMDVINKKRKKRIFKHK